MSFEKIIGQDIAVLSLKNMMAKGHVRGSYLFLGPDGVGKRTTAVEFAKAINCGNTQGDVSCDCVSCRKISSVNHPDVFTVYPEPPSGSIKIARIREIIYEASMKPYEGKKRIFIINNAEAMTTEAQNALLRLLEEPPRNHILILTAHNLSGILPTVISRCKVLKFNALTQGQVQEFLHGQNTEDKAALLFSHMAMGSIGRAMEFKEKNIIARRDEVVNNFFLRKSVLLREDVLSEEVSEDIEGSLYMLLCWYRDLLVSKFTQQQDELLNIDRFKEIFSYTGRFSKEKLEKDLLTIMKTIEYLRQNVNRKVALFNMAVELKGT